MASLHRLNWKELEDGTATLRERIAAVRKWLSVTPDSTRDFFALGMRIERVGSALAAHFDHEEAEGYFEDVCVPSQLAGDMNRLKQQHSTLLEKLKHLVTALCDEKVMFESITEAGQKFEDVMSEFDRHESDELQLYEAVV